MNISKISWYRILIQIILIDQFVIGWKLTKKDRYLSSKEVKRDEIPNGQWTNEANGKSYSLTSKKDGFYESSDICEAVGGNLASILNVKDQEAVNDFIVKSKPATEQFLWIGLNAESQMYWIWQKGKIVAVNFINWSPGQPASSNAMQDCGATGADGRWASVKCDDKLHGICEKPGLSSQMQQTESTNSNVALTAQQANAATSTTDLTTTLAPVTTTSSKGKQEGDSMKAGNFEKHPKLAKEDKGGSGKLKYTNGERCNQIKFINNYGRPVLISRSVHNGEKKEFAIEGRYYKLNTVFKKVENVIRMEPVVYRAKELKTDKKLSLEGKETFTLMPGDCDGVFVDVIVSTLPKDTGIAIKGKPILKGSAKDKEADEFSEVKIKNNKEIETVKKSHCKVETFGGNSGDSCCHFPFRFEDRMYHDCTSMGKRHLWCGTTRDFDNDSKWGYCCLEGECMS